MIDFSFTPPVIPETEYRLYYGKDGEVLFYTCDKPEGDYIVIDVQTYAECRFDHKIIDKKITRPCAAKTVTRLINDDSGIACAKEDVSFIVDENYTGEIKKWKIELHEIK